MSVFDRVKVEIDLHDIQLADLIEFVRENVSGPEAVFDDDELSDWAKRHGWIKDVERDV